MAKASKPREWWFNVTYHGEYSKPIDEEPFKVLDDDEIVAVIEKSAYDELYTKYLSINEECMKMANERLDAEWPILKERDALAAENERLKLMGTRTTYVALAEENNELRTANAELVEALESVKRIQNLESVKTLATMIVTEALAKHGGGT